MKTTSAVAIAAGSKLHFVLYYWPVLVVTSYSTAGNLSKYSNDIVNVNRNLYFVYVGLCRLAVSVGPSVCLTRSYILSKRIHISSFFTTGYSQTCIVVFP